MVECETQKQPSGTSHEAREWNWNTFPFIFLFICLTRNMERTLSKQKAINIDIKLLIISNRCFYGESKRKKIVEGLENYKLLNRLEREIEIRLITRYELSTPFMTS